MKLAIVANAQPGTERPLRTVDMVGILGISLDVQELFLVLMKVKFVGCQLLFFGSCWLLESNG